MSRPLALGLIAALLFFGCDDGDPPAPDRSPSRADVLADLCAEISDLARNPLADPDERVNIAARLREHSRALEEIGETDFARRVLDVADRLAEEVTGAELTVFLNRYISDARTASLERLIESLAQVRSVAYRSSEEVFREFKRVYRDQPEFYENLDADAFPPQFVVEMGSPDDLEEVTSALTGERGIREVTGPGSDLSITTELGPDLLTRCIT